MGGAAMAVLAQPAPAATPAGAIRTPPGCDGIRAADTVADADRVLTVVPPDTAPTAMDHVLPGVDVPAALAEFREILTGFTPVAAFELPSTGMQVTVLSDGALEVDAAAFDRLLRLSLDAPEVFADGRVADVQRCYARRLLHERELAGRSLRVLVPADPAQCFRAGRLVAITGEADAAACDSAGITLPAVDLRPTLFGLPLAELAAPATVVLTAAAPPGDPDADGRLARLLLHELHHVVENAVGLTPWNGSLREYEQRAYYVERSVRRHLRDAGMPLPQPVRFRSDAEVPSPADGPDGRTAPDADWRIGARTGG
jgi:hypothetical protein